MKILIRNQAGFTLLEVLIAAMISGIVLAAVMEIFGSNYKSNILQSDIADMQENLRIGMAFLDRDVTMIGSGMIGVDKKGGFNVVKIKDGDFEQERVYPITFGNGTGEGGSDILTVRYVNLSEGECGDTIKNGLIPCDQLPQLTLAEGMPPTSSNATVEETVVDNKGCAAPGDDCDPPYYPLWNEGCYCASDKYEAPQLGFFAIITEADGSKSDILVITGVESKTKLNNHKIYGFENKVLGQYESRSKISFFNAKAYTEVRYFLSGRSLMREKITYPNPNSKGEYPKAAPPEPLADNIDDLQFAFGLDTNNDGVVDNSDQWIGLNQDSLTDAQSAQVRLVRINLLGRTARANNTFSTDMKHTIMTATGSASDQLEDHAVSEIEARSPVKQKDRFFVRKLLRTTVKVRSLGL